MISIHLMGGLGNQLFQIFFLMAYGMRYHVGHEICFSDKLREGKRRTYWDRFLIHMRPLLRSDVYVRTLPRVQEKRFAYDDYPYRKGHYQFYGYFQSYRYFDKYRDRIIREIGIDQMRDRWKNVMNFTDTIAMHFRVGDYKELAEYHPILSVDYFRQALDMFGDKDYRILYFCEENDKDWVIRERIEPLMTEFPQHEFKSMIGRYDDWEEMLIMSLCDHHILSNSTFSYWGAYLSEGKGKVCYPVRWFGERLNHYDIRDLCPPLWIGL